jgi:hypothetical protein
MLTIAKAMLNLISFVKLATANITTSLWGAFPSGDYFKNEIDNSLLILATMKATEVAEEGAQWS